MSASPAGSGSSPPVLLDGVELRGGRLYASKMQRSLTGAAETVIQFTVSPNGKFVVFATSGRDGLVRESAGTSLSMWILNLRNGKRVQVGKDLANATRPGCCMLADNIENRGYGNTVKLVNGAYWTARGEVLVQLPARDGGGMEFFLAMDGTLKGDI